MRTWSGGRKDRPPKKKADLQSSLVFIKTIPVEEFQFKRLYIHALTPVVHV